MSTATFHFPKHRLGTLIRKPGGKAVADAVRDADAGLAAIADACLAGVDAGLARISELAQSLAADPARSSADALYAEVNRLIGLGAVAGAPDVDRVAFSLCEMLDDMLKDGSVDQPSIAVHVRALHLVRNEEIARSRVALDEVLGGLDKVRAQSARRGPGVEGRQPLK